MPEAHKVCERCGGSGIVARSRSADDPRESELCAPCGGSGKVTDWCGKPPPEARACGLGFIADQIRLER